MLRAAVERVSRGGERREHGSLQKSKRVLQAPSLDSTVGRYRAEAVAGLGWADVLALQRTVGNQIVQRLITATELQSAAGPPHTDWVVGGRLLHVRSRRYKELLHVLVDYDFELDKAPVARFKQQRAQQIQMLGDLLTKVNTAAQMYLLKHLKGKRADLVREIPGEVRKERQAHVAVDGLARDFAGKKEPVTWREAIKRARVMAGRAIPVLAQTDLNLAEAQENALSGGINTLAKVGYRGEVPITEAVFKPEQDEKPAMSGTYSGIPSEGQKNAHRAVALYRLGQLLGVDPETGEVLADVIPRTAFASHEGQFGTVMQFVRGSAKAVLPIARHQVADIHAGIKESIDKNLKAAEAGDEGARRVVKHMGYARTDDGRYYKKGAVTLELDFTDAELQRGLTSLQLIDAIAAQMDRKEDNYIVEWDPQTAKVLGVKGIDNDVSFGKKITDPEQAMGMGEVERANKQGKGVPDVVDARLARRVLAVTPEDIHAVLDELLDPAEVTSTIARLKVVQDKLRDLEARAPENLIEDIRDWGDDTLKKLSDPKTSYVGREKQRQENLNPYLKMDLVKPIPKLFQNGGQRDLEDKQPIS